MDAQLSAQAKPRIAIIDDDAIFVDMMYDLLGNGEGYEVLSTSHWVQAFEFVKQTLPDLVILDLMLGRSQTGWGVLQLLREDVATSGIPVILCSAAAPALNGYNAPSSCDGAVEAVAKPFDVDHLLDVIARLVAGVRASASASVSVA